jgi:Rieske Fe-S protein
MESTTRRNFYQKAIFAMWGLISGALALPAAVYLVFPSKGKGSGKFVAAAELAELPLNEPTEVSFRVNRVDGWKIVTEKSTAWVLKKSDTEVVAFAPYCTHLACAYHWVPENQVFLCPCHTTTFAKSGEVTAGPAPRALDQYTVRLEGGKLMLGPIRSSEEPVA